MEAEIIYDTFSQCGYLALFFSVFMGILASPIPDEIVVMTTGLAASMGASDLLPAFFIAYGAVIIALSLGYVLGRYLGYPVLQYLPNKGRWLLRAQGLVDLYGPYSLILSYLIPVVRHIVPYIVGLNGMPYWQYALCSYTMGLLWTLVYFVGGVASVGNISNRLVSF